MKVIARLQILLLVAILTASCWSANVDVPISSAQPAPVAPNPPAPVNLTFPRTAAYFLDQHNLPSVDELARYDVVVLDNDWANRMPRSFFDELRSRNPRLKLLAYVNVVDSVHEIGTYDYWANAYKLWQLDPSTRQSALPDKWLARTAAGVPVHEWEDRIMTNLTDRSPRINGQLFVEYAVDWIVNTVWSTGIWDGIFLDVWGDHIWSADSNKWDIDRDGVDETDDEIYGPGGPWARGLAIGEQRLRAALPDALILANGDRTLEAGRLNGRVFESFADPTVRPDDVSDVHSYVASASGGGMSWPPTTININTEREPPGSPAALRKARFEFGATLLQDGYWAPMGSDYGKLEYYDELDGAGLGRGYLGNPLEQAPSMDLLSRRSASGTGSPADGAFRRDFDNGIVIVNTSPARVTIPLERTYTKLKGTQDPAINDGAQVNAVTIGSHDAIVLLR
ncbi:MAG: hypothetical protein QOI01_215 [Mycobacterium sp.]|jgi:hypothetical protein|nr:hypothetical protein [Actinomycetota bacterium]MDT5148482.1 hypothetical protein [Mycobacterium sp.]